MADASSSRAVWLWPTHRGDRSGVPRAPAQAHRPMNTPIEHTPDDPGGSTPTWPEVEEIDGGYRVHQTTDGRYWVDVLVMLRSWRVVLTPVHTPRCIDRAWCYFGHGTDEHGIARTMGTALQRALGAAWVYDGDGDPEGFDKTAL